MVHSINLVAFMMKETAGSRDGTRNLDRMAQEGCQGIGTERAEAPVEGMAAAIRPETVHIQAKKTRADIPHPRRQTLKMRIVTTFRSDTAQTHFRHRNRYVCASKTSEGRARRPSKRHALRLPQHT